MYRARDLLIATIMLLVLSPVLLACALAVRLSSPGPVLFRQWRLGKHGRLFSLLKFRTMYDKSPDIRNSDGSAFAGANDARVTPIGRLLRESSLDELPQLMNVIVGHMSLVGPRPDQADQVSFYSSREKQKLSVRPGLTGLAQINGRNSITWQQRKALDLEYVATRSFWLDLSILCKTIPYTLSRRTIHTISS